MEGKIKITCSLLIIIGLLAFNIQPAQAGFFDWLKSLFTEEKVQEILPASIEPLKVPEETTEAPKVECPECPEPQVKEITKEVPVEKIVTKEVIKEVPIEKIVYKDNPEQAEIIQDLKQEIEILEARIKELEQKLVKAQDNSATDNSATVETENISSVESETPPLTNVEQYYSVVERFPRDCPGQGIIHQQGIFPNDISFSTDSNCRHYNGNYDTYGWWGEGIIVAFENSWVVPLNWLLKKEYIPSSKKDLPRIRKVFECEFALYLNDNGFIHWEDQSYREECEAFLRLTTEEQFEFNQNYLKENNHVFFYVPSSY